MDWVGRAAKVDAVLRTVLLGWVLVGIAIPAQAYVRTTSSVGEPVRWANPCVPFHIEQGGSDDVSFGQLLSALRNSMNTWMDAQCSALSLDYQGVTDVSGAGFRTGQTNVNVVVFRERAEEWIHAPSAFAVTTLTYCENLEGQCEFLGQIRDADIEINGAYFDFSAEISGQPPRVDLENTLTHELGHVLGLGHTDVEGATMVADAAPGDTTKRSLHADDIEGVCDIYPEGAPACGPYPVEGDYFAPDAGVDAPADGGLPVDTGCDALGGGRLPFVLFLFLLFAFRRRYG